jgi:hypothetical protein
MVSTDSGAISKWGIQVVLGGFNRVNSSTLPRAYETIVFGWHTISLFWFTKISIEVWSGKDKDEDNPYPPQPQPRSGILTGISECDEWCFLRLAMTQYGERKKSQRRCGQYRIICHCTP